VQNQLNRSRCHFGSRLSTVDYCNAILVGLPQTTLSSLQRVLHAAARMVLTCDRAIMSLQRCSSYTGFRSLKGSISNYVCWFTRHLLSHAPQYITDLIMPVADLPSRASLRTAHSGDLYVPRTCRRFGDRAFAVEAPRVWNSLPTDIKTSLVDDNIFQTPS